MNPLLFHRGWTMLAIVATVAACSPPVVRSPAPEPVSAVSGGAASGGAAAGQVAAAPGYTAADVRFVRDMLAHHAQALVMTELLPTRTARDDMRMLARRIDVSQQDEIATMIRWLERRGEDVPDVLNAHHAHAGHEPVMPGMLSAVELDRLRAATGTEFDRLFLEYMIRHHEGALVMVEKLFATPGAGQETELFSLAADIDADQRAEIQRMRQVLERIGA